MPHIVHSALRFEDRCSQGILAVYELLTAESSLNDVFNEVRDDGNNTNGYDHCMTYDVFQQRCQEMVQSRIKCIIIK